MASSNKLGNSPALLLDIQSSSVRGSLVIGKNIIFEMGIEIPLRGTANSKTLTENTLEAVRIIVQGILKDFILRRDSGDSKYRAAEIGAVHCIISSPWLVSQAQVVSASFNKETKITDKLVTSLLENKDAKPTLHITEEAHRTGQIRVIEKKVFAVLLNGYSTTNWVGKSAQTLDVSFIVSSASSQLISQITEICELVSTAKHIKFHSSLILHYVSSLKLVPAASDHICVHLHNEITDLISISKTGNVYFASYPVGIRTLVKRISIAMAVNDHTAESMLALYADMNLDPTHGRNSSIIIEKILQGWSREYHEFLKIAQVPYHSLVHAFISSEKYAKVFARLMRIPSSQAKIEPISENIYPEAINSLA